MAIPSWMWPVLVIVAGAASGCSLSGKGLSQASVDTSLTTSSIPSAAPEDKDLASDRLTIQHAVSSADLDNVAGADLSWKNAATGATGVVTSVTETVVDGVQCRRFRTTRTSYAGIGIHEGEICTGDDGLWWTRRFDKI